MNKRTFDTTELLEILSFLDGVLERESLFLEMAVYGGAAVMLYFGSDARESTEDVDGVILNRGQFGLHPAVFEEVATRFGLEEDWINSNIVNTLSELKREDLVDFGDFTHLKLRLPNKEQLLAMKIKSARYYPKNDFADAQKLVHDLQITSIGALRAIVDAYIPQFLITEDVEAFIAALLESA